MPLAAMGMTGISKSQVSRLCEEIDGKVQAVLDRPSEGEWPYLRLDAAYVKVRQASRIVSAAVIVAVGVNSDRRREVLAMDIGPSEAETFWSAVLRKLRQRGRRGGKLVVSDAHEGLQAAVGCFMRPGSALGCAASATPWPMPARAAGGSWPPSSPPGSPARRRRVWAGPPPSPRTTPRPPRARAALAGRRARRACSTGSSALRSMVGSLKSIGRVYLHAAVDTHGSYAFGFLHVSKQPQAAVAVLHDDVLPFYAELDLPVGAVLTDNGREFCGTERHPYELHLAPLGNSTDASRPVLAARPNPPRRTLRRSTSATPPQGTRSAAVRKPAVRPRHQRPPLLVGPQYRRGGLADCQWYQSTSPTLPNEPDVAEERRRCTNELSLRHEPTQSQRVRRGMGEVVPDRSCQKALATGGQG
jgi:hypothetical protein